MSDCPNADVRDLLPDLAHGRLHADLRAMVERHVAACAACAAEFALLRDLRATLRRTPLLDVAAIAAAVPAYRAPVRRSWVGWRTAAAITMIVAGGSSLLVLRGNVSVRSDSVAIARATVEGTVAAMPVADTGDSTSSASAALPVPSSSAAMPSGRTSERIAPAEGRELAMAGGSLGDLTDRELADLLRDIESLDALPAVDVEQATVSPVSPRRTP